MFEYRILGFNHTVDTIDLEISTVATGDDLIKKITVTDNASFMVATDGPPECATEFTFIIERVLREKHPFFINVTDCEDRTFPPSDAFPILAPGTISPGIPTPRCDPMFCREPSSECDDAVQSLSRLRSAIAARCTEVRRKKETRDIVFGTAIALLIAGTVLLAVGAVLMGIPLAQGIGSALAIVGAVLIAAAFAAFAAALAFASDIGKLLAEIAAAQVSFSAAERDVRDNCCLECLTVDLTIPACP